MRQIHWLQNLAAINTAQVADETTPHEVVKLRYLFYFVSTQ
jgi:hypothetical protein